MAPGVRRSADVRRLLREERASYQYGNIAADIINFKGYGGHYNHCLYWLTLGKSAPKPSGKLLAHIQQEWTDFSTFQTEFTNAAINTFGSGWAWLCLTPQGRLQIVSTPNQDNTLMRGVYQANSIPFMTCDVWEHAYYLQYQNRRPEYLDKFWAIVNWKKVEHMYEAYALNQQPVPADQLMEEA